MNAANDPEVEWQVRRIPLDAIQVDPAVQQRATGTSQNLVDEYAETMRNGIEFPPIDVFGDGDGPFYLGDGFTPPRWHSIIWLQNAAFPSKFTSGPTPEASGQWPIHLAPEKMPCTHEDGAAGLTNRHINSEREQKHTDPDNRMPAACPLNTGMICG